MKFKELEIIETIDTRKEKIKKIINFFFLSNSLISKSIKEEIDREKKQVRFREKVLMDKKEKRLEEIEKKISEKRAVFRKAKSEISAAINEYKIETLKEENLKIFLDLKGLEKNLKIYLRGKWKEPIYIDLEESKKEGLKIGLDALSLNQVLESVMNFIELKDLQEDLLFPDKDFDLKLEQKSLNAIDDLKNYIEENSRKRNNFFQKNNNVDELKSFINSHIRDRVENSSYSDIRERCDLFSRIFATEDEGLEKLKYIIEKRIKNMALSEKKTEKKLWLCTILIPSEKGFFFGDIYFEFRIERIKILNSFDHTDQFKIEKEEKEEIIKKGVNSFIIFLKKILNSKKEIIHSKDYEDNELDLNCLNLLKDDGILRLEKNLEINLSETPAYRIEDCEGIILGKKLPAASCFLKEDRIVIKLSNLFYNTFSNLDDIDLETSSDGVHKNNAESNLITFFSFLVDSVTLEFSVFIKSAIGSIKSSNYGEGILDIFKEETIRNIDLIFEIYLANLQSHYFNFDDISLTGNRRDDFLNYINNIDEGENRGTLEFLEKEGYIKKVDYVDLKDNDSSDSSSYEDCSIENEEKNKWKLGEKWENIFPADNAYIQSFKEVWANIKKKETLLIEQKIELALEAIKLEKEIDQYWNIEFRNANYIKIFISIFGNYIFVDFENIEEICDRTLIGEWRNFSPSWTIKKKIKGFLEVFTEGEIYEKISLIRNLIKILEKRNTITDGDEFVAKLWEDKKETELECLKKIRDGYEKLEDYRSDEEEDLFKDEKDLFEKIIETELSETEEDEKDEEEEELTIKTEKEKEEKLPTGEKKINIPVKIIAAGTIILVWITALIWKVISVYYKKKEIKKKKKR